MADLIRYDILAQEALRGLVRTVLAEVEHTGLPGEHHFFITFDMQHSGVRVSPRLRAQYPKEMTIVLQHQFWDLAVGDTVFEVGLSFQGIPEKLLVPFRALRSFIDPHAGFQLRFEVAPGEAQEPAEDGAPAAVATPEAAAAEPAAEAAAGTAAVVSLDAFRKKNG
jgi:hypothetical protein